MKPISFWVPATVCALISLLALFGSVIRDSNWWRPAFFAFLPMCFFVVGSIMFRLHREISHLRHRVARLEYKRQPGSAREACRPEIAGAKR